MALGKSDITLINSNEELDEITNILMDEETVLTGTLKHSLKKLSKYRKLGREELKKYIYGLNRSWNGPNWQ